MDLNLIISTIWYHQANTLYSTFMVMQQATLISYSRVDIINIWYQKITRSQDNFHSIFQWKWTKTVFPITYLTFAWFGKECYQKYDNILELLKWMEILFSLYLFWFWRRLNNKQVSMQNYTLKDAQEYISIIKYA